MLRNVRHVEKYQNTHTWKDAHAHPRIRRCFIGAQHSLVKSMRFLFEIVTKISCYIKTHNRHLRNAKPSDAILKKKRMWNVKKCLDMLRHVKKC